MKSLFFIFIHTVIIFILSGCQKLLEVNPIAHDKNLVFEFKGKRSKTAKIFELEVIRSDCSSNCVYWRLVNGVDSSGHVSFGKLESFRLFYGHNIMGLDTLVQAKALQTGSYILAGTAAIGDKSGGNTFYIEFRVNHSEDDFSVVNLSH